MIANTPSLRHLAGLCLLLLALPGWTAVAATGHPEDKAFAAARDAFARGDRVGVARALEGIRTHTLLPWAEYFQLSLRLEDGSDAGAEAFADRHANTYLGEKLRGEWLKFLVRQEDWSAARLQFARLQRPDAEAQCRGLDTRLHLGEPEALPDALALLGAGPPLADPCLAPLGRLAAAGELPADVLWERLRRQLALGKLKEARTLAGWLPDREAPAWPVLQSIADHPARHLAKLPADFADTRRGREQAMFAVLRVARSEVHVAAARWRDIETRFGTAERGFVWGRLALAAALGLQAEAGAWFGQAVALGAVLDEEQQAWRIRAALRAGDWTEVTRSIAALPEALAAQPEWIYWRGRAQAAAKDMPGARLQYQRIAGQPNFYGILASEALGEPYQVPPRAVPPFAEEMAAAAANPSLVRGLALIRADLRVEGVREWNWALTGMNDRQLLAAAELARRQEVIDRAINTADRTRVEHDFVQRYPTPFLTQVQPQAQAVGLDPAWVYGLVRQESRFILDARSGVGAKGLMQLMPATAKWVARKIGMTNYHPGKVTDMNINVTLGTNYLKMVMDSLDDQPVLASAAYNAGPGRARKWRAERELEGAIYAETIPFNETRDYVKKVLANTIHYANLMGGSPATLTQRLGSVRPRGFGDTPAESLP